jgi:hypothetical protein
MAKHIGPTNIKVTSRKRPGVHSKNGTSKSKSSKNYKKRYRGQGR